MNLLQLTPQEKMDIAQLEEACMGEMGFFDVNTRWVCVGCHATIMQEELIEHVKRRFVCDV